MITVNDFPALADDLESVFSEAAKNSISEMRGKEIFDIFDTDRRTHDHLVLHSLGRPSEVTPGQDLPLINTNEGDSITYTQRYFGDRFLVTKEMRKFDLHTQIQQLPKTMAEGAFDAVDQSLADVLLYGTSSSYTDVFGGTVTATTPGGQTLFNSDHTNNINSETFSNLINDGTTDNPALSRAAVVTSRTNAMTLTDPEGLVRPTKLDSILVAPENEDLAERIILSDQMSDSANNDTNPLKGKIKNINVWERLQTRSDSTDTSAYWFMYDSRHVNESLKAPFAERPTLDAPEQVYKNKNWEWTLDFFYVVGLGYPAYIHGSTGVN